MKTRMIFLALVIASLVTAGLAVTRAAVTVQNKSRTAWSGVGALVRPAENLSLVNNDLSAQSQTEAKTLEFTTVSVCYTCSTQPIGINDKGVVTGGYTDANGDSHGFLLTK